MTGREECVLDLHETILAPGERRQVRGPSAIRFRSRSK
jgi:hypothetical protein